MLVFNGASHFLTLKICYIIIYIQLYYFNLALYFHLLHVFSTGSYSCLCSPYNQKISFLLSNWHQKHIIIIVTASSYHSRPFRYNCNVTIIIFMLSAFTLESEIFIVYYVLFIFQPLFIMYIFIIENNPITIETSAASILY